MKLLSLLSQEQFQTASELAAHIKISEKTMRQMLKALQAGLQEYGTHIVAKRGVGYKLRIDDFEAFQNFLSRDNAEMPNSSEDRVQYILEKFLEQDQYIKAEELCEELFICRKTLFEDLKQVKQFFRENQISFESKPYYGMRIVCDEFQRRLCIVKCRERYYGALSAFHKGEQEQLKAIEETLLNCLADWQYQISDLSLQNLIVHISVAVKRIQSGQYAEFPESTQLQLNNEGDLELARVCADAIEKRLKIKFPENEIIYLAIHLAGKETGSEWSWKNTNLVISSHINQLVHRMLEHIFNVFGVDFRDDLELTMALGKHLIPLEVRLCYGLRLKNPILLEIQKRYSLAYVFAEESCALLENYYGKRMDKSEVAYIALAFALAMERSRSQKAKKTILLVCASGMGTARLLAYKMKSIFHDCIGEMLFCDEHSAKNQDFSRIDYVFTTVPIRDLLPVPVSEIGLFFEKEDIESVEQIISGHSKNNFMKYYPYSLFFSGIELENKEQVLDFLCRKIAEEKNVPSDFRDAVFEREQMAQTGMGAGAAMPHPCRIMSEDTFVAVGILNKEIQWGENQQVQVVFLVVVSKEEDKRPRKFYDIMANLVMSKHIVGEIIKNPAYETLIKVIDELS